MIVVVLKMFFYKLFNRADRLFFAICRAWGDPYRKIKIPYVIFRQNPLFFSNNSSEVIAILWFRFERVFFKSKE
jgi:hypothetical protein